MSEYIQPVSKERYEGKTWRHNGDFSLMKNDTIVSVVVPELPTAMMSYPIGLFRVGEGYQLVAIIGVDAGENLQITSSGKWSGNYVPRAYCNYPFFLADTPNGEKTLCIDERATHIGGIQEGNTFFEDDGKPSAQVSEIFASLLELEKNKADSVVTCKVIEELKLIVPWELKIDKGEEQVQIQGLYKIDEDLLNQLSGAELENLRNAGGLVVVFCQLLSMQNLHRLAAQYIKRRAEEQKKTPIINLSSNDDMLSFDNF